MSHTSYKHKRKLFDILRFTPLRLILSISLLLISPAVYANPEGEPGGEPEGAPAQIPASVVWDGTSTEKPKGGGTLSNPYLITEPAELAWISAQNKNTFENTYFRLMNDIDLGGHPWTPIRPSYTNKDQLIDASKIHSGFMGHIDGNGHTIKNLKVLWNNITQTVGFGFICYLNGGSVKDITFENAIITRTENKDNALYTSSKHDMKIGIVAAAVGQKAELVNINLVNCHINDGGLDGRPHSLYVGSVAGDVASAYAGSDVVNAINAPRFSNIVAQVEIDLGATTRNPQSDKLTQFNVGGIMGRVRRTEVQMSNLMFTGSIKAPVASVGPIYSILRYNGGSDMKSLAQAYGGESAADVQRFSEGEPADIFFYNFSLWNPIATTPGYEDITNTYPPGGNDRLYGARTFSPNNVTGTLTTTSTNDWYINNPEVWARVQGVNRGYSIDAATPDGEAFNIETIMGRYNLLNPDEIHWSYDADNDRFNLSKEDLTMVINLSDIFTFRAEIDNHPDNLDPSTLQYTWSVKMRNSDLTWNDPIVVYRDENPEGLFTSEFTLTSDLATLLQQYINEPDFDIFDRFIVMAEAYVEDPLDPTRHTPLLNSSDEPVSATGKLERLQVRMQPPTTYIGTVDMGQGIVELGAYHLQPVTKLFTDEVTYSPRLRYEWLAEMPDGTWREPTSPFSVDGAVDNYIFPAIFDRGIKVNVYSADAGILMGTCETTLQAADVQISALRPENSDEQVYGVILVSPYDGKTMAINLAADWTCTASTYSVDALSQYLTVNNSDLSPEVAQYTLTATYTWKYSDDYVYTRTVTKKINRLTLYFNEERDPVSNEPCFYACLAMKYGTEPGNPVKYQGNPSGTWKWYVGNLLDSNQSLHEVTEADGLTIVNSADGRDSRLYGYDNDHIYRVVWTSKNNFCTNEDGTALKLTYDKTQAVTLYVYDKTLNEEGLAKGATTFNGKDPDGVDYTDGSDSNDGKTPWRALKTIEEAYRRLPANGKMSESRIVLMGFAADTITYRFASSGNDKVKANIDRYSKPVTVCGKYYAVEKATGKVKPGNLSVDYGGCLRLGNNPGHDVYAIMAPHTFADLTIWSVFEYSVLFYANRNDLTFDKGVTFKNFKTLENPPNLGLKATDAVPEITIVTGSHNYNQLTTQAYIYPLNEDKYLTTVTIRSGAFARIIGTARNNGVLINSKNVTGSPEQPFRSRIVIDIEDAASVKNDPYYLSKGYTHNIGLVTGGQTDGTVWGDVAIEIHKGHISRYISGNISYGRYIEAAPDDSFFGRTELNLYGGNVDELFGGSLGRYGASATTDPTFTVSPYFYGNSIINVYGGTIKNNLYGAGSGGVIGIGRKTDTPGVVDYSPDMYIPYYNSDNILCYGPYSQATALGCRIPEINVRFRDPQGIDGENDDQDNFTHINLADSSVELNIYGGTIEGNVYGGGYGHSTSMSTEKAPYGLDGDGNKICVAGNLYGRSHVYISGGHILGNVYGGGAGSDLYNNDTKTYKINSTVYPCKRPDVDYTKVAQVFGSTDVQITGGVIGKRFTEFLAEADTDPLKSIEENMQDVANNIPENYYALVGNAYGGGQGIEGMSDMAAVYGNSEIVVSGGTIMNNVFAGGDFADIRFTPGGMERASSGNASVVINGGVLGNSIFGGSRGSLASTAHIDGSTYVTVNDGVFLGTPFINEVNNRHGYRDFNIYGGGYYNCIVEGNATVRMNTSLMNDMNSFMKQGENPNEWPDAVSDFQRAYMDLTYRRFCVYGGGYGEKTRVLNTDVTVYISELLNKPHGITLSNPYYKQSLFDIAGGGYSGDVGYWIDNGKDPSDPDYESHHEYVGGECRVLIEGYTYARKVIGGGFYGSCRTTNIDVKSGSLRQIYGGSLLGYVHDRATLNIGNRIQDFLGGFDGDLSEFSEQQIADAARKAKNLNNALYVTENVYAGNDVKGIIGTTRWRDPDGRPGREATDGAPLFAADVDPYSGKGIEFNIYGGTFMGDVYCAGNGYYRGYYVPEWVRYNDGPARMYSDAISSVDNPDGTKLGKVYRARPMVGCVKVNIQGNNTTDDRVRILGDFYGGGRACTIGQWNTLLPFEDPRRLVKGGFLNINFGSHVDVHGGVYMGADGAGFNTQIVLPDSSIDLDTFNGSTTKELEKLGKAAYGHWYYNLERKRYEPGYPAPGEVDGNYGMTGEHMLRGYLKNIEMAGDLVLTFFDDPYEIDPVTKKYKHSDVDGSLLHKRWVPAEKSISYYDANDIFFHDFYLGGRCGSMTNNVEMKYIYTDDEGNTTKPEEYGAIYRITLPHGVSIANRVVMGSLDASTKIYPHNSDYTAFITEEAVTEEDDNGNEVTVMKPIEPWYSYDGGIVTQSPLTFDIIAYNNKMAADEPGHVREIALPSDFYTDDETYAEFRGDSFLLSNGTTIYRKKYSKTATIDGTTYNFYYPNWNTASGYALDDRRYDLAVTRDDQGRELAYAGMREDRASVNAVKGAIRCNFTLENLPEVSSGLNGGTAAPVLPPAVDTRDSSEERHLNEGGLLYGGCYNSGLTMGNVILIAAGSMLCEHVIPENYDSFSDFATLKYNIGRVYGGGYGSNTCIDGNTYVNLLMNFRGLNVFGGGHGGTVTGSTNINYVGTENSYVYGSIYGGGLYGPVGTDFCVYDNDGNLVDCLEDEYDDNGVATGNKVKAHATDLSIISGNVSRVYGGACLADLYGSTNVTVMDQAVSKLDHLDLEQYLGLGDAVTSMTHARLIVGSVYGGNDIAGTIYTFDDPDPSTDTVYDTNVTVEEYEKGDGDERMLSPGSKDKHNGFPLIGTLYGGSNGAYGTVVDGHYTDGTTKIYIGQGQYAGTTEQPWITLDLAGTPAPNVARANINISGGTIVDAYCGGNNATVTEKAHAVVNYSTINARAGFDNTNGVDDPKRIWNLFELSSEEQFDEVLKVQNNKEFVYKYQIYHFYSGNDNADMDIQPEVHLNKGHIGSAYGGGNNGRMTFCEVLERDANDVPTRHKGISLTVDSPEIHIENLYGGGRIGDIRALYDDGTPAHFREQDYGATLNIYQGLIEGVYGGNDVCGNVHNGTNVNIYGAISGDVYGAGNGNYLYQLDESLPIDSKRVYEEYDDAEYGGRYFRVAPKSLYGEGTDMSGAMKIMTINSYRPNVEKAYLNIHGFKATVPDPNDPNSTTDQVNRVWVKGSVYCGGNSSTIRKDVATGSDDTSNNTIRFNIGDYVVLNSVFLGSNGESLADTSADGMMMRFEKLNGIELNKPNDLDDNDPKLPDYDLGAVSKAHYPRLLSLYMRAVEVDGLPDEFRFDITKDETYIGDFCLGGNRGSMMTKQTISVTFPEELTIFGNIIGGCYDTAFQYQGALHSGGMTRFLRTREGASAPGSGNTPSSDIGLIDPTLDENNKVWLSVKSHFYPLRIKYPVNDDIFQIDLELDLVDGPDGKKYYGKNRCNIYGGCYNSGLTVGDIRIDLYSDMAEHAKFEYILNGVDKQIRALDVVGGGYGKMSYVIGDTKVRMLPGKNKKGETTHPRCSAIFGGSQEGQMLGNTFVSVRDGQVMTNVYGGSESAILRGSTNVIIGYPETYRCKKSGIYYLRRTDNYSEASMSMTTDARGNEIVKKSIKLLADDVIAANVYEMITGYYSDDADEISDAFDGSEESNENKKNYFLNVTVLPETFHATWDDIDISIGVNNMYNLDAGDNVDTNFYGHGNVYGGGFVSNLSDVTLAGKPTVLKYDGYDVSLNTQKALRDTYGGNSMIMISDNPNNSDSNFTGAAGEALRDHISIGTASLKRVVLKEGENKIGRYYIAPASSGLVGKDRLFHQEAGKITAQDVADKRNVFYEVESDGGIYGGGRKVFVEGFRSCDLQGYGYADHTPQHPKHLGTIQRIDLFTMRDCCMQLTGAPDYASSKIDATPYSMTRVGELRMESSIPPNVVLDTGTDHTLSEATTFGDNRMDKPGYMVHSQPRSRNYMGFFNQIHYVGAINSTTRFEKTDVGNYLYHDENGASVSGKGYKDFKDDMVAARKNDTHNMFPKRNVGTAHNMLGINNGFTFKVQGAYYDTSGGKEVERVYYGPVEGVIEVKLLTLIANEGGGYIYALNKHGSIGKEGEGDGEGNGEGSIDPEPADHFTEATGNFVFPGRLFSSGGTPEAHYMLDDCYPMGYDSMEETGGGWANEPVHYWYVSGNSYYFNTTLTAYTYNHPKDFFLHNYDSLIMLAGLEEGKSDIKIKSVTWGSHSEDNIGDDYDCDLTNFGRTDYDDDHNKVVDAYQLYFTVDKNTEVNFKELESGDALLNGAYVSRIPRDSYILGEKDAADGINPNATDNGTYGHKATAGDNTPTVGITLRDNIDNTDPEYYRKYLADPHKVTLEIEADTRQKGDVQPVKTYYTINLTIVYLQGPNITGNIVIDNCALPGEIINANTGNMNVALAEELVIEDRKWIMKSKETNADIDVTEYRNEYDYTKLELPVWYYNNNWDLVYRLVINGENFDVETDPKAKHHNIEVHNYHRMKAMYGESEIYQVLTPGCRIYIEDLADLEKFIALADTVSRSGYVPGDLPGTALKDRPVNCEGLTFILQNALTLPERDRDTFTVPAKFGGWLYGNGYNLYFSDTTPLFGTLTSTGKIRDIGFIGSKGDGYVMIDMEPRPSASEYFDYAVANCYFYATDDLGGFNRDKNDDTDSFANCGQNCNPSRAFTYHDSEEFTYGRAAYNVNGYYLMGRKMLLDGAEKPFVKTVDNYYRDGDFRFANHDPYGVGTPTALRTKPRPNYLNRDHTGVTYHNMDHLAGERYVDPVYDADDNLVDGDYFKPLWPDDYLKFGQSLTALESTSDNFPVRYNGANRVYRTSGFYGTRQDRGFHFNKDAVVRRTAVTAIDFTGYRDKGQPTTLGRQITDLRDVMSSPMLDLPDASRADYGIDSFTILSSSDTKLDDGVSRNVLIYTKEDAIDKLFDTYEYTEDTKESDIYAHVLVDHKDGENDVYDVKNDIFHLVDCQDFNAPMQFNVGKRAWYERTPDGYSAGNNAWEGICLPFAANRVSAFGNPYADGYSPLRDHGEITHFYGNEQPYDTPNLYNRMHEYWLRSLVGTKSDSSGDALVFARPGMTATPFLDENGTERDELTANYHYSNVWFPYTFGEAYRNSGHNQYTEEGRDYEGYKFLTNDIPYIVSFPSDRYYEFDLSGEFYRKNVTGELSPYRMSICYEYLTRNYRPRKISHEDTYVGDDAALTQLTIGVTDEASRKVSAMAGSDKWLFEGTFSRVKLDEASYGVLDEAGMNFRRSTADEIVLPFRAYVSAPAAITTPQLIASPKEDPIISPDMDEDEEYNPTDIEFSVEHNVLVVRSPRNAKVVLCDVSGRVVRKLDIRVGRNEYRDIDPGVYIAGRFKFII